MAYCVNCGTNVVPNAKFCQKCGHPMGAQNCSSMRNQEFAGKLYKCPNCGEVLKAFEIHCPSCGYELRGIKASNAVKEFTLKLEAIESRRVYEKKTSDSDEIIDTISKTDLQKISLIKSFSVPNSKEDMLEFMILATSNIDMKIYGAIEGNAPKRTKEINDAWLSKVQQIYEKAKHIYSEDDAFKEIKLMYDDCIQKVTKQKEKARVKEKSEKILGGISIVIVAIVFICYVAFKSENESRELRRLENIVDEVQTALDNGEYKHALNIAQSIDYQRYDVEMERKWDIQKDYWIDKVLKEAVQNGMDLEYTPTSDIDNANDKSNSEESDRESDDKSEEGIQQWLDFAKEKIAEFETDKANDESSVEKGDEESEGESKEGVQQWIDFIEEKIDEIDNAYGERKVD